MLSDTYSKTDCQAKLSIDGFGTIADATLTDAFYDAKYFDLIPIIGESLYDALDAIAKADYTTDQLYIYWSEVYFAMAKVAQGEASTKLGAKLGASESISVEGYSSSSSGVSGKSKIALGYAMKAYELLGLAGYDPFKIGRN